MRGINDRNQLTRTSWKFSDQCLCLMKESTVLLFINSFGRVFQVVDILISVGQLMCCNFLQLVLLYCSCSVIDVIIENPPEMAVHSESIQVFKYFN